MSDIKKANTLLALFRIAGAWRDESLSAVWPEEPWLYAENRTGVQNSAGKQTLQLAMGGNVFKASSVLKPIASQDDSLAMFLIHLFYVLRWKQFYRTKYAH